DELLTEELSHFRAHDPPNDVSWSARGKWNDHLHRACRIIVSRAHRRTCKRRYQHGAGKSAKRAALDCSSKNPTPPSMLFGHDISSRLAEGYHHRERCRRRASWSRRRFFAPRHRPHRHAALRSGEPARSGAVADESAAPRT